MWSCSLSCGQIDLANIRTVSARREGSFKAEIEGGKLKKSLRQSKVLNEAVSNLLFALEEEREQER